MTTPRRDHHIMIRHEKNNDRYYFRSFNDWLRVVDDNDFVREDNVMFGPLNMKPITRL